MTLFGAETSQETVHKWQEFLGSRGYRQEDIWSDQSLYFRWGERNKVEPEGVFQSKERHYFIRLGSWGHFSGKTKIFEPSSKNPEGELKTDLTYIHIHTAVYVLTHRHIHAYGCYISKQRWMLIGINHCLGVTVAFLQSCAGPYVVSFLGDIWLFLVTCHFWLKPWSGNSRQTKNQFPSMGCLVPPWELTFLKALSLSDLSYLSWRILSCVCLRHFIKLPHFMSFGIQKIG